ncbi:c-type cytochrome biogenesis protein CcmI [Roseibium aggregatum]|uniref:C-type cytochrome biogenesis protein CcmI n=1 Tax=Roseibium aggregatum TaxID=187304 RepID=A0A926P2C1_9HYPH|nr:c-type cytochrome biogenesis protein CcmI [Roseibium aggregatum]MBD1545237.1 c-type cytochrome biogenesis protein CcmI [Roseibium aggregatum]
MTLWILIAVMTAVAALSILVPMSRKRPPEDETVGQTADEAVYRQQLDEVEKDLERGLIDDEAANAARTEIARRLLAAHERAEKADAAPKASWPLRFGQIVAIAGLPLVALGVYLFIGSPDLPDQPLAARMSAPPQDQSVEMLVARVEKHLAENPQDGQGWDVLAPVYMRLNKPREAAGAYQHAIRLLGPSVRRMTDLGEALTVANDGIVSADARGAFEQAIKLDKTAVKPRFFIALALGQEGKKDEAIAAWQDLLKDADPRAAWVPVARQNLAALDGTVPPMAENLPGPNHEQMAAAADMSAADRNQMVAGMVGRLAERLNSQGGTPAEWARLIRAYTVLGKKDEAQAALQKASAAYAGDPAAMGQIAQIAGQLGLAAPEGMAPPMAENLPGPNREQMAAAADMNAADRNQMIAGMVGKLADRLNSEGGSPAEWSRLIRAYTVLGKKDEAQAAFKQASAAYADDPAALGQIKETAGQLGLKTE